MSHAPFVCPKCDKESYHPKDKVHGWCALCSQYTGRPKLESKLSNLKVTDSDGADLGDALGERILSGEIIVKSSYVGIDLSFSKHSELGFVGQVRVSNSPNSVSIVEQLMGDERALLTVVVYADGNTGVKASLKVSS